MHRTHPLPPYLINRYHGWKATTYADNKPWYRLLAEKGQRPRAMIISCCDSRVHVTSIFGADQGEFFIHRNIANLVPPYDASGGQHGTSATIEYAVMNLNIAHLIIMAHSHCGGAAGCDQMCAGTAPELEDKSSFVGRWMDILRPGYDRVAHIEDEAERLRALEKETVLVSLDNLTTFPFVESAIDEGRLTMHGLWLDIGSGELEQYIHSTGTFTPV
ncbi:carbonic anhydrase [Roseovarius spongiae]|uniref:carbonic anhydrase n=1 Tax=Roseovarius spongiae TaxID=2320272 RepID=A0A3A8AY53_9RHOB|nr:carbonic anhydrase [Roseovarius spongiae]RKF16309.1 carbonic anhydrase [Roseovarius spongiae]